MVARLNPLRVPVESPGSVTVRRVVTRTKFRFGAAILTWVTIGSLAVYAALSLMGVGDTVGLTIGVVSLVATVGVAIVAMRVSADQSRIAEALQRLELQEKVAVIVSHTRDLADTPGRALTLLSDARAGLAVFDLARTSDQYDFLTELQASVSQLDAHWIQRRLKPSDRAELFVLAQRAAVELEDLAGKERYAAFANAIGERLRATPLGVSELRNYYDVPHRRVRVLLNWDELLAHSPIVETRILREARDLEPLFHPWYWDGTPTVDYETEGAVPIRVGDRDKLGVAQASSVSHFAAVYGGAGEPTWLVIPTYSWGAGRRIVLDGNHRLAGIELSGAAFRILELEICGPCLPQVLPDVARHDSRP